MFTNIILLNFSTLALSYAYLSAGSVLVTIIFYILLLLLLVFALGRILFVFVRKIYSDKAISSVIMRQNDEESHDAMGIDGYDYDSKQDIFYSVINPWQRKFGQCRLYDEALALQDIIIDCEPITFSYGGKNLMIQLCKGQYGLSTGCEIGFYRETFNLEIAGLPSSPFYRSVEDEDMLHMAFSLKKDGNELFSREDKHWWLNGYRIGEFSNPAELSMDIGISFNDMEMCYAFIDGLLRSGYPEEEIAKVGNKVYFTFNRPYSEQSFKGRWISDMVVQMKNKTLCAEYKRVTSEYGTIVDKLNGIKSRRPDIYRKAVEIGKNKNVYKKYDRISKYI